LFYFVGAFKTKINSMLKTSLTLFLLSLYLLVAAQNNTHLKDSLPITKHIFHLGEVTIKGKPENETNTINSEKIQAYNKLDVSNALDLLPGVNLSKIGGRNESVVLIRGFDLRQVPLFIDGVPVYVPYDGYVDLGRFTTFDISEINVSKGFSSITYGANTLGGAINLVSRRPVNKLEIDARAGVMNMGSNLSLNAGSRLGKFYMQGSVSDLKQVSYPLSKDFVPTTNEDGGARNNAFRNDKKYAFKLGYNPKLKDEYAISWTKQDGTKGNPPYVGNDPTQIAHFWKWPFWNKESLYFISNTTLTSQSNIKTRLYYDTFENLLSIFDNSDYVSQIKSSSSNSLYNDKTFGGSAEYSLNLSKHHFKIALQYKNDLHKEHNVNKNKDADEEIIVDEPFRSYRDYTASIGIEDSYQSGRFTFLPGISFNTRHNLIAQEYNSTTNIVSELPESENDAYNAQFGAVYQMNGSQKLNISIARKTRFATIKDRFSYRMGTAIPNPNLKSEAALHYEAGYTGTYMDKMHVTANVFYSRLYDAILSISNVQGNLSQLQNTGRAEFYGSELSVDYTLLKDWTTAAQYSYLIRNNLSNRAVKFINAPENKVLLSTNYQYDKRASVLANVEYNSSRYSTSAGFKSAGFAIANLGVRIKAYKWISLDGGVNNLFDKNYTITEGYPEAGRMYFVNLVFNNL
jgi:iron complex outermembrane receptor protein